MSIAPKLRHYLDEIKAEYDLVEHQPTKSSLETATASSIPPGRVPEKVPNGWR